MLKGSEFINTIKNLGSHKKVKITEHAKLRLKERCPHIQSSDYMSVSTRARYKGVYPFSLPKNQEMWINERFKKYCNSNQIRVYNGVVYVFAGHHSRTLLTVYKIPDEIVAGESSDNDG